MRTAKLLFSILSISVAANSIHAQLLDNFGVKVGVATSSIRFTDVTPITASGQLTFLDFVQGSVVSPSASIFADVLKSDHLNMQIELTYLRKGASRTNEYLVTTEANPDGDGTKTSITTEIGLHYLELAVLAQPKLPLGDVVAYANVGPSFGYLLSITNLGSIGNQPSRVQIGYILGIGFNFAQLLNSNFFIEMNYAGDFRYFYEHRYAKLWNRTWAVCIGTTL